jgi:hypothetical protein
VRPSHHIEIITARSAAFIGDENASLRSRLPLKERSSIMHHQGIEYTIVQTANPFGWRWSFDREGRSPKTGISYDRVEAILAAEGAINQALKEKRYSK